MTLQLLYGANNRLADGCAASEIAAGFRGGRALVLAILVFATVSFLSAGSADALDAEQLLVVANDRMTGSVDIADYYMKARSIPGENLVTVSLSTAETISRDEFVENLLQPIQRHLQSKSEKGRIISGIVLVYGVPLKVQPPPLDWNDQDTLQKLQREREKLTESASKDEAISEKLKDISQNINALLGTNKRAAVDSELMLAKSNNHKLAGWLENPYFLGFQQKMTLLGKNDVMLVARLDGPDEKTVYRLIDDALAAEKEGLAGKAYFDARWPPNEAKAKSGYKLWDASLHRAAALVEKRLSVHLDQSPELLAPGSAPDAALYCGWYSLARYVDSFTWAKGAIGYHIASAECSTLKKKDSQVWCLQMLNHGVAATIGPVYEPYVQGFPLPEIFFGMLVEGYMNLGESYLVSLPFVSWQMILVGDPLYKPFQPMVTQ